MTTKRSRCTFRYNKYLGRLINFLGTFHDDGRRRYIFFFISLRNVVCKLCWWFNFYMKQ